MIDVFSMRAWELGEIGRSDNAIWGSRWTGAKFAASHKFLFGAISDIPAPIHNFGRDIHKRGIFRLPFELTTMEFTNNHSQKIIILCEQVPLSPEERINDSGQEMPPIIVTVYPLIRRENGIWNKIADDPILIKTGVPNDGHSKCSIEYDKYIKNFAGMVGNLCISGTVMLMSKSTNIQNISVPERIATARARAGKLPVYSFSVVTAPTKTTRRTLNGGRHASPRLHWRRGHYRRISGQVYPVAPCLVGLAENGVTEKVYRVDGENVEHPAGRLANLAKVENLP